MTGHATSQKEQKAVSFYRNSTKTQGEQREQTRSQEFGAKQKPTVVKSFVDIS